MSALKWVARTTAALVLLAVNVGCSQKSETGSAPAAAETKPQVAIVVSTLNNPWFVVLAETARDEAQKRGFRAIIFDSQNDSAKESAHFDNIVASRYAAVLLNATDATGSIANAAKAKAAKIPVFTMDREINSSDAAVSQILSDNYSGAVSIGEAFVEMVGDKGTYVELLGIVSDNNTWNRSRGFHSVVDRYPGLKMVAQQSAEFDRSKALEVMDALLQKNPAIDAVFCGNDAMALGAYQALLAAGRADRVKVFGFDGSDDAIRSISEGKLAATAMQYPKLMAKTAVEYAERYLKGDHQLPGKVPVNVDLVTRENVAQFESHGLREVR